MYVHIADCQLHRVSVTYWILYRTKSVCSILTYLFVGTGEGGQGMVECLHTLQ